MSLEYIKDISDSFIKIDKRIGFRGILKYVALGIVIIGLFNFNTIVKNGIEIITELQDEIHLEKFEKRDQLLTELLTLLAEFRGHCNADRVLFFEYHNSKENLVGIPFKYLDLTLQCTRYGLSPLNEQKFRDINSGAIVELYNDIKFSKPVYYSGEGDTEFMRKYPGAYSIFNSNPDGGEDPCQRLYLSIPGYNQPLGIIVIEWNERDENRNLEGIISSSNVFLPRVNSLIQSKK